MDERERKYQMKIQKKVVTYGIFIALLLIGAYTGVAVFSKNEKGTTHVKDNLLTESFVRQHLLKEDGRIQTNITRQKDVYLSETVGLWMEYLVMKNDFIQFDQQVDTLKKYFLTKDYLVIWELKGTEAAPANAFIDDLRIIDILYSAGKQWNHKSYTELADKMSKSLVRYQTEGKLMVDFIELESKNRGGDVTLSYIIPSGFDKIKQAKLLPDEIYEATRKVLLDAPYSAFGFSPKSYSIPTGEYSYDTEVNLIDQFYVGYHRAQWKGDVTPLVSFAKSAFEQEKGKLYGRYDSVTGKPVVAYESVAVYALAVLMCLEIDDVDFAEKLYVQMKTLQQNDESLPYLGGYIDMGSKNTHTFDNLLALIAERRGLNEKVF